MSKYSTKPNISGTAFLFSFFLAPTFDTSTPSIKNEHGSSRTKSHQQEETISLSSSIHLIVEMPSLDDCPTEILCGIFGLMPLSSVHALLFTNKRLRNITEPLLYSRIEWTWLFDKTPPPIQHLLRSVLDRPELGRYIRCLALKRHCPLWFRQYEPPPKVELDGQVLADSIAWVKKINVSFAEGWIRELRAGTMDALLAVLVSRLPDLTTLRIEFNFAMKCHLLGKMMRSALTERGGKTILPNFELLQDITFRGEVELGVPGRVPNTEVGLTFFYLPNIRRLSALIENPIGSTNWLTELPRRVPSLVSLDLNRVREPLLTRILAATSNLRSLRWRWYHYPTSGSKDPENWDPTIDLDQVSTALEPLCVTLIDLEIHGAVGIGDQARPEPPEVFIKGSLSGLSRCSRLVNLQAPLPLLMGSFSPNVTRKLEDVVPRNIECLGLWDVDFDYNDQNEWDDEALWCILGSWLKDHHWREVTPNLRQITLFMSDVTLWEPPVTENLAALCAEVGVGFEVCDCVADIAQYAFLRNPLSFQSGI
jgi:hypothetical protein